MSKYVKIARLAIQRNYIKVIEDSKRKSQQKITFFLIAVVLMK